MSDRPLESAPGRASVRADAPAADSFWRETWAVFVKDIRSELRTRAAVATILLFSVVTLTMVNLTIRTREPISMITLTGNDTPLRVYLLASLLWIILFFSAMAGLPRAFVKEEEMRTVAALRLTGRPTAVLAGKLLFNGLLSTAVAGVLLLLFLVLFTPQVKNWPLFLLYVLVGAIDMAGTATILGAIVARAGGKTYLMLPLAFPILLPILILVIKGTATAMQGSNNGNQIVALVSYLIAMVTLSAMLFDKVWSDQ